MVEDSPYEDIMDRSPGPPEPDDFANGGSSLMDKINDMKIELTKLQTKTDMIWSDVIDLKKKKVIVLNALL